MKLAAFVLLFSLSASAQSAAPKPITVKATALGASPGAIVCKDMATVSEIFHQYSAHWEDAIQDRLTNGRSKLVRGQSAQAPILSRFGCYLAKPGTPMLLDRRYVVPVVSFRLPSGKTVRGVTQANMLIESKEDRDKDDADWKAKMEKQFPKPAEPSPVAQ